MYKKAPRELVKLNKEVEIENSNLRKLEVERERK